MSDGLCLCVYLGGGGGLSSNFVHWVPLAGGGGGGVLSSDVVNQVPLRGRGGAQFQLLPPGANFELFSYVGITPKIGHRDFKLGIQILLGVSYTAY